VRGNKMAVESVAAGVGKPRPTLLGFASIMRNQQALLLSFAVGLFWFIVPLFGVSFRYFTYGLCVGNILFSLGLAFDVLLIHETDDAAAALRPTQPALAHALSARTPWRWRAFGFNLVGTLLCLPACLYFLGAEAQAHAAGLDTNHYVARAEYPPAAIRDIWLGNLVFSISLALFTAGFAMIAAEALITMREVARATGTPEPPLGGEASLTLLGFLGGLVLLTLGEACLLLPGTSGLLLSFSLSTVALTAFSVACVWNLRMMWQAYAAGQVSAEDPMGLGLAREPDASTPLLAGGTRT